MHKQVSAVLAVLATISLSSGQSSDQEKLNRELSELDFEIFLDSKINEKKLDYFSAWQTEMNLTQAQVNELRELTIRSSRYAERLVFTTLDRSDPAMIVLRNETNRAFTDVSHCLGRLDNALNVDAVDHESVAFFFDNAVTTLKQSTQDPVKRSLIMAKLDKLATIKSYKVVDEMEVDIYRELCLIDSANHFFRVPVQRMIVRMAKQIGVIEKAKGKNRQDYVDMLQGYYDRMQSALNNLMNKQNCRTERKYLNLNSEENWIFTVSESIQQAFLDKM